MTEERTMPIEEIVNPINRFVAFIEEREAIRVRRLSGKPWPWTTNEIMQTYRFTNIHREDDTVSRHYQKTIRDRYGEFDLVFPATVLYRWFNRVSTCDALFNEPDFTNHSAYEQYMESGDIRILKDVINKLPPPHVTGAFIINGKPGFTKGEGVLEYFDEWMQKPWREVWHDWLETPPMLVEIYEWLMAEGLGTFMRGQIVADLKYLKFLVKVPDWWTWAAPGPGSMRGLNAVLERPLNNNWKKGEWLKELTDLNQTISPILEEIGLGKLHNQDLQNCLCEFSKFTKTARGTGRPRQVFRHKEN